ncbi:hypothetical protein [Anabaena sp. CS-542/02]|uniref:hypothetical protein n=1 Tax=Anabaena sp. CS-542/02 TaxID=3021719 RepID=UPI00232F87CE|nr:hypothetical protein [Anabaena sp. CS-542/02]MDB9448014.1 hypothetical protein [Anabaena sp. CS-542/02]
MSNLLRKGSMLATMVLASGSMMLAAAPSYAGNEIEVEALGDVIPACDILGQTVGRLVESVPGDGTDELTRGRLISAAGTDAPGQLAIVGLSCNADSDTIATITSPVQISGPDLDINVATTRAYLDNSTSPAEFLGVLTTTYAPAGFSELPLMAVTSEVGGAVKVSDAVVLTGDGSVATIQNSDDNFAALGIGFEVEVNGSRIPSGQFGFATTLSVVPR